MYNFAWASKRFWDAFNKPSIFGEAGADLTYYKPGSKEYHISYHNQIWASLANGLACTPVWWTASMLNDQDWQQLEYLSEFVKDIDFASLPFKPTAAEAINSDVYIMDSGDSAFGWVRAVMAETLGNTQIALARQGNDQYTIQWFDTWTGKIIKTEKAVAGSGRLILTVPEPAHALKDIAFKINKI
jgi:hypothetical protein